MTVHVYRDESSAWRWRAVKDGRVFLHSRDSFSSLDAAADDFDRVTTLFRSDIEVYELDTIGRSIREIAAYDAEGAH